jgi:site-specific DNA recombinase
MRQLLQEELHKLESIKQQKNLNRLRVAIYARKSREDIQQVSLENQVDSCKAYLDRYPSLFVLDESNIYAEDNVSGMFIENREQLHRMIDKIQDGQVDVIICTKVDRLSRSGLNAEKLIQIMNDANAYFIGGDDLGDNSASGVLLKQIQWSINEFQVRRSVEDMISGKIKKTKDGYSCGGPGNFGYDVIHRRYVINPQEAIAVGIVFDRFVSGQSYSEIIEELEVLGFTTRNKKPFRKSTINAILTNERNAGINVWNAVRKRKKRKRISRLEFPEVVNDSGIVEPIVTIELFNKAKMRLEAKAFHRVKSVKHSQYLLTGIIHCAHCGRKMTGNNTKGGKSKKLRRVYECANHKPSVKNRCPNLAINADFIEKYSKDVVADLFQQRISLGINSVKVSQSIQDDNRLIKTLKKQVQNELQMIDKLTMGLVQNTSSAVKDSIAKKITQCESFITKAKARMNELQARVSCINNQQQKINSDLEINKSILGSVIKDIKVSTSEIVIEL